jgi:hypothetical protein
MYALCMRRLSFSNILRLSLSSLGSCYGRGVREPDRRQLLSDDTDQDTKGRKGLSRDITKSDK